MTADPARPSAVLDPDPGRRHHPPSRARSERTDFWRGTLRGWDVAFYLMVVMGAVTLVLTGADDGSRAVVLGLLALLTLAYTVVGRRAVRTGSRGGALAYLVVLIAVTIAITRLNPGGSVLLFLAYSQIWFFTESRRAGVVACAVLTVGVFTAIAAFEGFDPQVLPEALTQGSLALVFAVLLGLWVTQVAEQSQERAELVDRLEAAQTEIGRSHHAAGVAAERERMAQEIHDTLAQGFTSIVMLTQAAEADLGRGEPERASERIALIERTARDNLAEARALVAAFAPVALDGGGLVEALRRLAERFTAETGVPVDVVVPDHAPALAREDDVVLLRAAQEALANVRRHAGADRVEVVLALEPELAGIRLEVVDDGRGIAPEAGEGFGLRGMRERVASGGGVLTVSAGPRGGTRLQVTLPTRATGDDGVDRR